MPGDNEGNDGAGDAEIIAQLRAQIQTLEAASGETAAAATAPPADVFRRALYGLSNIQKLDAYSKQAHAISLMLLGVSKSHPAGATREDDRKLVEAFERKGLGLTHARQFFEYFRTACDNTKSMARLETVMRRLEVKSKYDAAMAQETIAMEDLQVDDSLTERRPAVPWGNFKEFWTAFRAAFLGVEVHTWQAVHKSRFGHSTAVKSMGDEPFAKWVSTSFLPQQRKESNDPHTPTHNQEFGA